jgi:hypothetical protein
MQISGQSSGADARQIRKFKLTFNREKCRSYGTAIESTCQSRTSRQLHLSNFLSTKRIKTLRSFWSLKFALPLFKFASVEQLKL